MSKDVIKNYLIMIIGAMVIGIGVCFVVYGDLGGDAMTTFQQGLSVTLNIGLPTAQIIANGLFVVILFFLDKKSVNIDTILCPLFITLGCKLTIYVLPTITELALRYVYMIVGIIIVAIGIAIGAQTKSGSNPYDGTVLVVSKMIKKSFSIVRPICDISLLVIGIILNGSWGVGTIVATFATGYIANFFMKLISKSTK